MCDILAILAQQLTSCANLLTGKHQRRTTTRPIRVAIEPAWRQHIYDGARTDNQADRVRDGTDDRGSKQWQAKLTEANVRAIRSQPKQRTAALAIEYDVSVWTIRDVRKRKKWAWLED
jgi:hypothetical protein